MYPWLTFFIGRSHKSPAIIPVLRCRIFFPFSTCHTAHNNFYHHPGDGLNFSVCNFSFLYETSHNQKARKKEKSAEGEIMFHIGWREKNVFVTPLSHSYFQSANIFPLWDENGCFGLLLALLFLAPSHFNYNLLRFASHTRIVLNFEPEGSRWWFHFQALLWIKGLRLSQANLFMGSVQWKFKFSGEKASAVQ